MKRPKSSAGASGVTPTSGVPPTSGVRKSGVPDAALIVGWREWLALPELKIAQIKVKIDTGARTSALHASKIEHFTLDGEAWVRFRVHPVQDNEKTVVVAEAPLVDERWVRSSSGQRSYRPVVETTIVLGSLTWPIELTLVRRDLMGFRMLLGRQAMRGHLLVNPGKSFLAGMPRFEE